MEHFCLLYRQNQVSLDERRQAAAHLYGTFGHRCRVGVQVPVPGFVVGAFTGACQQRSVRNIGLALPVSEIQDLLNGLGIGDPDLEFLAYDVDVTT